MKIMHLCMGLLISNNSGVPNYVRTLANTQFQNGMDVVVVGRKDKNHDNKFKYIEYNDFYIRPFALRYNKNYFAYKKIERIIKTEKPDLVHIHTILDADIRIYKIFKRYNIKYIVSLHDYSFLCPRIHMFRDGKPCEKVGQSCKSCAYFLEQTFILKKICDIIKINKEKGKRYSPKFLERFKYNKYLLEGAELLLPVSNRVKEIYKKSGIQNEYKIVQIGNITADKFIKYKKKNIESNSKIKVVMLGNFSKIKGGDEFIKIANKLKTEKFEFYFLGRSSIEEKEKMKENNIIDKGPYKQSDLHELLKEYDFGCVLSIWEDNAPQVVMELLNNNIPVIGTKMGGITDFIQEGKNGFLYNPFSEKSFKDLISKMKRIKKAECEEMKENIDRTLTPEEHFRQLNEVYKNILIETK